MRRATLALLAVGVLAAATRAQDVVPEAAPGAAATAQDAPRPAPGPTPPGRVGAADLESLARADDAPVVRVGPVELRRSDVFRVLDLATPSRSAEVIRQMVLTTAAQLDALAEGIDVPEDELAKEIERAVAEQKASFALEIDEALPLEEYLRLRHGLSAEDYHAEVRRMVLSSMLLERAVRLDAMHTATDRCSVILVEDRALADEIAQQLRNGASFSVLAKRHSKHPSAAQGGELPPIPVAAPVPLCAGRDKLQPGGFLGPAPFTGAGKDWYRLLRLAERTEARVAPWSEVRAEIEAGLVERPLTPEELAVFEARVLDRYGVTGLPGKS